jgi:nicotinamidase-related amidase
VLTASRLMAEAFREKAATVIYVRVDLADMVPLIVDVSHFDPQATPIPTIASELVPDAGFKDGDLLITKRHWGAFGQTELEAALKQRGVETIVLAGIATNFGVESTARQATSLGFQVVIAEDACSSIGPAAHKFAMETIFPLIARVRKSQEIVDALN